MLDVIALRKRPDKEALSLLPQPFWLSAELGVLDDIAAADEAGRSENQRTEGLAWRQEQACDQKFTGSNLGQSAGEQWFLKGFAHNHKIN